MYFKDTGAFYSRKPHGILTCRGEIVNWNSLERGSIAPPRVKNIFVHVFFLLFFGDRAIRAPV